MSWKSISPPVPHNHPPAPYFFEITKKLQLETMTSFTLTAQLWKYSGESAWHFITLPLDVSARIKFLQTARRGFGSVRVLATVGASQFETSVFPDAKSGCYLLPVKTSIRKAEKIGHGDEVTCLIELRDKL